MKLPCDALYDLQQLVPVAYMAFLFHDQAACKSFQSSLCSADKSVAVKGWKVRLFLRALSTSVRTL